MSEHVSKTTDIPIVAVGASAGGIEALKSFIELLPADPACSFVILQHLAPDHESQLTAILSRVSRLPVVEADHDLGLERNTIYVLPPNKYLRVADHGLFVEQPDAPRGLRTAIDYFMKSLAGAIGPRAVGVVLSGTGSDGTVGLRTIRGVGGLALVQSPETARYDGMPRAAIEQGVADFVGPIPELVNRILAFAGEFEAAAKREGDRLNNSDLKALIAFLKSRTGHDFSTYKPGTIIRRIVKRMNLLRFAAFDEYLTYLRTTPVECDRLFQDLLINVTSFFRDPNVWPVIAGIIEKLVAANHQQTIRVWVPACASGEEAYSLAILFEEICTRHGGGCRWQIFATDLDADAIGRARDGFYPLAIESDVEPKRLQRFFRKEANGYRVEKSIRERVVFAPQNLLSDPPFSRIDLISCRNLLIYLNAQTQNRLLDVFHFALADDGYLILGTSETTGQRQRLFQAISSPARVYRRLPGQTYRVLAPAVQTEPRRGTVSLSQGSRERGAERGSIAELVRRSLLARFGPASAVIDADGEASYYHGPIRRFLNTPEGEPSNNLFELLPPVLRIRLREVLREAIEDTETSLKVRRARLADTNVEVRVECERLKQAEGLFLVSFVEEPMTAQSSATPDPEEETDYARKLEHELIVVREDLQTTIEELETSNEELKASHEEAMAANEELQSTNEELETSREEMQSLNEELVTVNGQLAEKVAEAERATSDLENLFASTTLPVLFLGSDLSIRSFTPSASEVIEVRESDIGRPITELAFKVQDPNLAAEARRVLADLSKSEQQVTTPDGQVYLRRIQPYRAADERIGGVVISFAQVTDLVETARRLSTRERQQRAIADLGQTALNSQDEQSLLDHACSVLRATLDCDFVRVLQLRQDEGDFLLRAGTGWKPGLVGKATVENTKSTFSGFAVASGEPVVVRDFDTETRLKPTQILIDHGVHAGMNAPISVGGKSWGVISAHNRAAEKFAEDDVSVLVAAANILSQALTQIAREEKLARERLMLDLAVGAAGLSVWSWNPDSDRAMWDDGLYDILGLERKEVAPSGKQFFESIDEADRERVREEVARTWRDGMSFSSEFRIRRPDGTIRWVAGRGARIPGSRPSELTGVLYDITDRKENERRQALIMRELDHRVKNVLAIVLSISRATARPDETVDSFLQGFSSRVQAMARAHALLSESRWQGMTLRALLNEELAQFRSESGDNIVLDGPDVLLPPAAGQALSMAFHELATNAAKYGALSCKRGEVRVRWVLKSGRLVLSWQERNGPTVEQPKTTGFGSTVLKRILTGQLQAEVEQEFVQAGLQVTISIPDDRIESGNSREWITPCSNKVVPVDYSVLRGAHVLILDDEWLIGEEHRAALEAAKAEPMGTFTDLTSAQTAVDGRLPDLAILDFNIAGEPVTPIATRLRQAGVPVIIVTGYGSSLTMPPELADATMMHKPITISSLLRQAAIALGGVRDGHAAS